MMMTLTTTRDTAGALFRASLTRLGARSSDLFVHRVNAIADSLAVGHWLSRGQLEVPRRVRSRFQVFDAARPYVQGKDVLYLEFGVAQGTTLRYWRDLLSSTSGQLYGFDSFQGMPQAWNVYIGEGDFDQRGQPPQIEGDTSNVHFVVGYFEETLPDFVLPPNDLLILNCDADLYSSTTTILNHLGPNLRIGSLIYFDEFNDRVHELRAFDEFLSRTAMKFRVISASQDLAHIMFERVS
jgi:hypothetical protein